MICVVMREESPHQFEDTISLFEYGFSNFQKLNIAANETQYTVENNDFFETDNDVFGESKPILRINSTDNVVIPVTAVFEDLESVLSYDTESEASVASIQYMYHGIPVGTATVDLAEEKPETFEFENQTEEEEVTSDTEMESEGEKEETKQRIVFIDVKKLIFWTIMIAGFFILIFVIRAIINNYQFAKRRKIKTRHKKRKRIRSEFDDFDF